MLLISMYVCCCSSMTWLSRKAVQHEQWKASLHAEGRFGCTVLTIGAGLQEVEQICCF